MGIAKVKPATATKCTADNADRLSKIQTVRLLQEIVHHQLYEATNWPMNEIELKSFYALLAQSGLERKGLKKNSAPLLTAFGEECGADVALCLVGATDPHQVPLLLRIKGLITEAEADAFYEEMARFPDADIWMRVEPLVYRAHHRWRKSRMDLRLPQPYSHSKSYAR